jgi:integrase
LDFIERPRREVETISADHVAKMLDHALAKDLGLLPFLVLAFFCGIRPDGELQKILWSDIHVDDCVVVIRPEVAKTKRHRFPELSENAIAWLKAYQAKGAKMLGKVVPCGESELRTRRTANWKGAGLPRWIHSGMRHTFCSN